MTEEMQALKKAINKLKKDLVFKDGQPVIKTSIFNVPV